MTPTISPMVKDVIIGATASGGQGIGGRVMDRTLRLRIDIAGGWTDLGLRPESLTANQSKNLKRLLLFLVIHATA